MQLQYYWQPHASNMVKILFSFHNIHCAVELGEGEGKMVQV